MSSSVTDLWRKPMLGARESGARGAVAGAGYALMGSVAKPMSASFFLASKVTEGFAKSAKRLTPTYRRKDTMRVREPREIGPDGVLLKYPSAPSMVQGFARAARRGSGSRGGRRGTRGAAPAGMEAAEAEPPEAAEADRALKI